MTTAFVLSGGGSLGSIQVGMLHALAERGFRPDLLIGTSAGALNAGFIASNGVTAEAIDGLGDLRRSLRRRDVFPVVPARALIDRARRDAGSWIDSGNIALPGQERFLSLHGHAPIAPHNSENIDQRDLAIEDSIRPPRRETTR